MKYVITVGTAGYLPGAYFTADTLAEARQIAVSEKRLILEDREDLRCYGNIRRDWGYRFESTDPHRLDLVLEISLAEDADLDEDTEYYN